MAFDPPLDADNSVSFPYLLHCIMIYEYYLYCRSGEVVLCEQIYVIPTITVELTSFCVQLTGNVCTLFRNKSALLSPITTVTAMTLLSCRHNNRRFERARCYPSTSTEKGCRRYAVIVLFLIVVMIVVIIVTSSFVAG